MIPLEQQPRPLRVAARAAIYSLVVCLVVSLLPVWNTWDATATTAGANGSGLFWEELVNGPFGDTRRPGRYIVHNLLVMAAIGGLAFVVAAAAFWFGPRVKDKDDEPRRLRVRMWES